MREQKVQRVFATAHVKKQAGLCGSVVRFELPSSLVVVECMDMFAKVYAGGMMIANASIALAAVLLSLSRRG